MRLPEARAGDNWFLPLARHKKPGGESPAGFQMLERGYFFSPLAMGMMPSSRASLMETKT